MKNVNYLIVILLLISVTLFYLSFQEKPHINNKVNILNNNSNTNTTVDTKEIRIFQKIEPNKFIPSFIKVRGD